jgi:hypothetical protein
VKPGIIEFERNLDTEELGFTGGFAAIIFVPGSIPL